MNVQEDLRATTAETPAISPVSALARMAETTVVAAEVEVEEEDTVAVDLSATSEFLKV